MIANFYKALALVLILIGLQTGAAAQYYADRGERNEPPVENNGGKNEIPAQYVGRAVENELANVTILYQNGHLATGATSKSGVSAPHGFVWSETQNDAGNTLESNSVLGFGAQFGANRLADNFTIPAGQTWIISSVSVYAFRGRWTSPASPFSGASLRVWSGRPGTKSATVVFGDTTTNRLLSSTATNIYRISNTQIPAPGFAPDTTRLVWENKISVAPALALGPGTYWIDFDLGNFDNNQSDQFVPVVTVLNKRGEAHWNARQFQAANNAWFYVLDGGMPASAPDIAQDVPFKINGTIASPRNIAKFLDFNGDGKTDFAVTRFGPTPASPTTWHILPNATPPQPHYQFDFGIRAGTQPLFSGIFTFDRVLPGDYDGDGKTDFAVWRRGSNQNAPQGFFYILQSSNNQLRSEQFGNTGDNPGIFGDYDGDGKTDLAIYRQGATPGSQNYYWVRKSSDGTIFSVPWGVQSAQAGVQGDRAFPGDFDGDGRADFAVVRSNATESNVYILYADGRHEAKPIEAPFTFVVPGDYDGDGKTDIATIKSVLNEMVWTIQRSGDGITESIRFGVYSQDYPAQGDYNGDGKTDVAVYHKTGIFSTDPSYFIVRRPDGSQSVTQWGGGGDNSVASVLAY
jgi:hypothetical protein